MSLSRWGRSRPARPGVVLAVVCLAVFAINLDTTIVNVALPTLARRLGAGTRDLQWIVDGYNLAFAALVLAGGSVGDRIGRRPVLVVGLVGFALASALGAMAASAGWLIGLRFVMGGFAALIYPTTLSVIANTYPDRRQRTRAIGVWGAVTGLGVAVGPVTGGLLLAHFWWGSVFLALVPLAALAAVAALAFVPESRQPGTPPLDARGLAVSSATIGLLVYTIIEAPGWGWASPTALAGFALTAVLGALFVVVERRRLHPMLDVSLFKTPAFSAASASVTVAFFALFGFIFLITQYMQLVRGYGTLSTGTRILPVAGSIAVGSVLGARLAARFGTRWVVVSGLTLFGIAFAWIAASPTREPYLRIALQMVIMGSGLGLTSTPATESILSVLPAAKAGVGSAVNDATREAGGTLGVAVIGSVFSSVYVHHLAGTAMARLPAPLAALSRTSVGAAFTVAARAPHPVVAELTAGVSTSFMSGLRAGCLIAAGACWLAALGALALPGRLRAPAAAPAPSTPEVAAEAAPAPLQAGMTLATCPVSTS